MNIVPSLTVITLSLKFIAYTSMQSDINKTI